LYVCSYMVNLWRLWSFKRVLITRAIKLESVFLINLLKKIKFRSSTYPVCHVRPRSFAGRVFVKNRLELYSTQISTISFLEPGPGQKSNISNVIYMQKGQKVCKSLLLYIPLCFRPNWFSAQPTDRLFYAQKWDSSLMEESAQNH
jgi:hypothetical protein